MGIGARTVAFLVDKSGTVDVVKGPAIIKGEFNRNWGDADDPYKFEATNALKVPKIGAGTIALLAGKFVTTKVLNTSAIIKDEFNRDWGVAEDPTSSKPT